MVLHKQRMRILISISRFEPGRTLGSEVFLGSFLDSLAKITDNEQIAIMASQASCQWGKKFTEKVEWIPQVLPSSTFKRMIFERLKTEDIARQWKADVIYFPFNIMPPIKTPGVLLLHDLVNEFYRQKFPRFRPLYYSFVRHLVRRSIKRADTIITVSQAIKNELHNLKLLSPQQQIYVVPEAVNQTIYAKQRPQLLPLDKRRIILQPGAQLPHKSHITGVKALVEVFKKQPEIFKKIQLVLTGGANRDDNITNLVKKEKISDNVVFLGRVSAEELEWLMQEAEIVCFPTLYEGFGLGIVDAQLRGTSIIASDIPVLREVSGNSAIFFEPENAADLACKIINLLEDKENEKKLISDGKKNVTQWSWLDHSSKVLKILKDTAKR